jgi:regulator of protease activity HflC (stomatin/prohibitin superfamily)
MCCSCCTQVHQAQIGIVESMGRFDHVANPGCVCLNPCTQSLVGFVSLRVRSITVLTESKTRDNVIVVMKVAVQLRAIAAKAVDAFYKFSNADSQIASYVINIIRGQLANHTIDEIFLMRNDIEKMVKSELDQHLSDYGYQIVAALVIDISPAQAVKQAMEATVINSRVRMATQYKSEMEKIRTVKAAEAQAEAKRLSGVGVAEERRAAIAGLQESVTKFEHDVPGMRPKDIMSLLLMNQYFDAVRDIAEVGKGNVVFMPDSGTNSTTMSMLEGTMAAGAAQGRR